MSTTPPPVPVQDGAAVLATGPIEDQPLLVEKRKEKEYRRRLRSCVFGTAFAAALVALIGGGSLLALPATYSCAQGVHNYYVRPAPFPNWTSVDPPVVCARATNAFRVVSSSGDDGAFVVSNGVRPSVVIGDQAVADFELQDCADLDVRMRHVQACRTLLFNATFPESPSLEPTTLTLAVANPPPFKPYIVKVAEVNCSVERQLIQVIPAPNIEAAYPPFLCRDEATNVTLTGTYFLESRRTGQAAVNVPTFSVCGAEMEQAASVLEECKIIPDASGYDSVKRCSKMYAVAHADACEHGANGRLSLVNPQPAVCSDDGSSTSTLFVASPPDIFKSAPNVVCPADGTANVRLYATAKDFLGVDWQEPIVSVLGTSASMWTSECEHYTIGGHQLMACSEGLVGVPRFDYDQPVAATVSVTSSISSCAATKEAAFVLEPRPLLAAVSPNSVCAGRSPQVITASGRFVVENGTEVTVTVGGASAAGTALENCTDSVVGGVAFKSCSSLKITVPTAAPNGKLAVSATTICSVTANDAVSVIPTPTVETRSLEQLCFAADTPVSLTGASFLVEDSTPPSVTVGGVPVSSLALGSCTAVSDSFELCQQMDFSVDAGSVPVGPASLLISNGAAKCNSAELAFEMVPAPTITSYTTQFCENQGADVEIIGTNFAASARVFLQSTSTTLYEASSMLSIAENRIVARFAPSSVPAGEYDLVVKNSPTAACQVTSSGSKLSVHANTLAIVDAQPAVVMSDETTQITLHAAGFTAVPKLLTLVGNAGKKNITFNSSEIGHEVGAFDRLFITLPAGAVTETSSFSLSALAVTTCVVDVSGILSVASATTFALSDVAPVVANSNSSTTIKIVASASVFNASELPNVFLSGHVSDETSVATSETAFLLDGVQYISSSSISAMVPKNTFSTGLYDITVASKSGPIAATMPRALTISASPAPAITGITPRAITADNPSVNITGTDFQTGSTYTLEVDCGGLHVTSNTINGVSSTQIRVTLDISKVNGGTTCTLVLKDTTLEYVATFFGLAVMETTRNLKDWHQGELPSARCGASAVSAMVSGQDYIYLIGGDTDSACTGLASTTSVIASKLGTYGETTVGTWTTATALPQARSFAAAERIGNFIYVVGGFDGTAATKTVFRAQILQPSESPVLSGRLATTESADNTLAAGVYYYCVSALYKAADELNPAGETLPSNVISVAVPSQTSHATVSLTWDSVYEATGYNVYRTATPGQLPSNLVLLAEVTTTAFVDTGASVPGTSVPKQIGALGNWATVADAMTTPRYGHALTSTESAGSVFYIFAFDGAAGTNSYESMQVTVYAPTIAHGREHHTTAAWRIGSRTMTHAPFRHAVSLDSVNMGYRKYLEAVVVGGGQGIAGLHSVNTVDGSDSFVNPSFSEIDESSVVPFFGACLFASDGFLYSVGGTNSTDFTPVSGAAGYMRLNSTAELPADNPLAPSYEPSKNSPLVPVAFAACVQARGNIYLVGGKATSGISDDVLFVAA